MCKVVNEMCNQFPESFFGYSIFLAANMAILSLYNCAAIKAILLFSFWSVRHLIKFSLKYIQRIYIIGSAYVLINIYAAIFGTQVQNMKKSFTGIFFLMVISQSFGQYYYSDIAGTQQTNQQYKTLISNQLKKISAVSYEANNQPVENFLLEQLIDNTKQQIVTRSKTSTVGESFFISSYRGNKLSKTVDSSSSAVNTVQYQYEMDGKLKSITSTNKDFDGTLMSTEIHNWFYNAKGQPEKMYRVKNNTDTTYVTFAYDEAGNVGEETWKKKNRVVETYYYYYNAKNQLTDIVRYSKKARQMLPDFIMEYDEKGRVVQMTQTQSASANYLIWRYLFNTNGLKEKEMVYNKKKEFLGKIEYSYQ